jgi:hypothetical protein
LLFYDSRNWALIGEMGRSNPSVFKRMVLKTTDELKKRGPASRKMTLHQSA